MASTTSRGNYYKAKSKEYYEKLGYVVQITEFMCGRMIAPNKMIYIKKDVFGSDGIAMNGKEIIFWNSKHFTSKESLSSQMNQARKEFNQYPFPEGVTKQIVMWEKGKKPIITNV